jgi:hypothetical protein
MKRTTLLILAAALLAACDDDSYRSAQISNVQGAAAATINLATGISIPAGSVVSATIQLVAADGDNLTGTFSSADPSILQVFPASSPANTWVFLGVTPGTTSLEIIADGAQAGSVAANVSAPPGSVTITPFVSGTTPEVDAGQEPDSGTGKDAGHDATLPADAGHEERDSGHSQGDSGHEKDAGHSGDAGRTKDGAVHDSAAPHDATSPHDAGHPDSSHGQDASHDADRSDARG